MENSDLSSDVLLENELVEEVPKIDAKYLANQVSWIISLEKGLLFTLRQMTFRPGTATRNFIKENRRPYMKPVVFLILCSLIYTIISKYLQFEEEAYKNLAYTNKNSLKATQWIREYYGYFNIVSSVISALWIRMFFRKKGYNIFEIIVLMCYLSGIGMLISLFFGTIQSTTGLPVFMYSSLLILAYSVWGIGQFFELSNVGSYLKVVLARLLGLLTIIFLGAIGMVVFMIVTK